MKLSRDKINVAVTRKTLTVTSLAEKYGVSRARMNATLNGHEVTTICTGRVANSLKVDVTEILED